MAVLIKLGDQHVAPSHIVQVLVHPVGRDVCVVLTNGQEVRFPIGHFETKDEALARVASLIMRQVHE